MCDNITNHSPSLITGGFLPPLFGGERGCGGKGGGSLFELLQQDIATHTAQDVSQHPEWDEILQRLEKCFIDRDTQLTCVFCDYYGVTWQLMLSLKKMIDSYIVKDDESLDWHYIGPPFDEPAGGD